MLHSATKLILRGWSPAEGNEEEIYVSDETCLTTSLDHTCGPPLHSELASAETSSKFSVPRHSQFSQLANSSPLLLTHRFPIAPSSDRRAHRNRSRDPSWIPRPRNAFIIFRCDYSREHAAQTSQESDEQSLSKTLSKRAAEAWKQLCAAEKDKYRHLADREREEHARIYPNYRFRPMRRQALGSKKPYFDHLGTGRNGFESSIEAQSHSLSLATSTDIAEAEGAVSTPNSSIPEELNKNPEKATRRRSSSVPYRDLFSNSPVVPSHRRDRRSFSFIDGVVIAREPSDCVAQITHPLPHLTLDDGGPIAAAGIYPAGLGTDAYCVNTQNGSHREVLSTSKSEYSTNTPQHSIDLPQFGMPFGDGGGANRFATPVANGASSLCGWDGNFGPLSPSISVYESVSGSGYAASSSSQGSSSSPPGCTSSQSVMSIQSQEPSVLAQSFHQPPCEAAVQVTTDMVPNFGGDDPTSFDTFVECSGDSVSPSYDEMERAQALEAYAIGLQDCDLFSPVPGMFAATPFDPPQPSFEEELARLFPEQASQPISVEISIGTSDTTWQDGAS
ncbi:hypothetical protein V8B97DRAFT_2004873 [Scleroderma yunnanense]